MTPSVSRPGRRRRMISTTHDHRAKLLLTHSHNVPVTIGTIPEIALPRRSKRITISNTSHHVPEKKNRELIKKNEQIKNIKNGRNNLIVQLTSSIMKK